MKKLLDLLERWVVKAIQAVNPGRKTHMKEGQISPDEELAYEQERVVLPDQYYVTRTGQTMRKPYKRKKYYRKYRIDHK